MLVVVVPFAIVVRLRLSFVCRRRVVLSRLCVLLAIVVRSVMHTRNELLEDKPITPEGKAATPGSVAMIKWKIEWEDWTKKEKN